MWPGRPWKYLSSDMNWQGVLVGLCLLALLIADLAILGSTTAGYVGGAVIVLASAPRILRGGGCCARDQAFTCSAIAT